MHLPPPLCIAAVKFFYRTSSIRTRSILVTRKHFTVVSVLFAVVLLHTSLFGFQAGEQTLYLQNGKLKIGLDAQTGLLREFSDLTTNFNFLDENVENMGLWQVDLLPGTEPKAITPSAAKIFKVERSKENPLEWQAVWEGFNLSEAPQMRIIVSTELDNNTPVSRWSITVANLGSLRIEKVKFPRIVNIRRQEDERLAVPVWMGQVTDNPREVISKISAEGRQLEWPYPGTLSLQCLTFYRENGPGLYLSCDDTAAFRKTFAFWGDTLQRINYEMGHYPENQNSPRTTYFPSYRAIVGTFQGDWITAAEQYREWGTKQNWAQQSRLSRGLVPDWLLNTGMWVWNRGRSEKVLQPAVALQKELGLPVSVFWHWWHGCAYDTGFPEYLPPREGTETFKKALADAHQHDIRAIVYMNQRLWGMTTQSWNEKGAERFAVKTINGTVHPEVYNTFTGQACASMCLATPFWRNTYAGITEEAVRFLGVDGIYMDQACSSLLCYDPTHGHPLGGGTFWMNGFRQLSTDIRARTKRTRNVLLAGEGSGEAWLPYLDLMLTLQVSRERYATPADGWVVIPFFQAVYHAYGVTYGNYSSLTYPPYDELWPAEFAPKEPLKLLDQKYSDQFYLEQARTFAWGVQPTIANFLPSHLQERQEETAYMIKLAKIRAQTTKYLLYGTFLRSPLYHAPEVAVDLSRLSIYAGQREGLKSWQNKYSSIVSGTWRAKDGSIGISLASILNEPMSLTLDVKPYKLKAGTMIFITDESGKRAMGTVRKDENVNVNLPARGACVIELIQN